MDKYPNFIGQPIFSQLLNLVSRQDVNLIAKKHKSDYYTKSFNTYNHLITMMYCIYQGCTSIREVSTGLQACFTKLNHLGLNYCVRRSTLSDANRRRSSEVFEAIYFHLFNKLSPSLSDSRNSKLPMNKLYIADSTTISLFQEILKNAGRTPANGKRKGGMKVHTLIRADQDIPCLVRMTSAASHDVGFIKKLKLPKGSIIVFDKGYIDYEQYERWSTEKITWVSRLRKGASYTIEKDRKISTRDQLQGILSDKIVIMGHTSHKDVVRTKARLIEYYDKEKDYTFTFTTNNNKLSASNICLIYKHRWQIELLFKRLKQNYPLQYFLGDNENAIKIQVWCALIADLLVKYINARLKRKWSYSNLRSMVRIHLMTYISLINFLNNPDSVLINNNRQKRVQPDLFNSA